MKTTLKNATRNTIETASHTETPMDGKYGSLCSIFRDRNTPATGQSVRLFSRNVFRVMTTDGSATSVHGKSPLPARERSNFSSSTLISGLLASHICHRVTVRIRAEDWFVALPPDQITLPAPLSQAHPVKPLLHLPSCRHLTFTPSSNRNKFKIAMTWDSKRQ